MQLIAKVSGDRDRTGLGWVTVMPVASSPAGLLPTGLLDEPDDLAYLHVRDEGMHRL
jgi:hypothetical protein